MGFYLRKSIRVGPLRLNLSRSGLGASFGVTGARVGVGPRGTYIHAGRGGLYYRQTLSPSQRFSDGSTRGGQSNLALDGELQEIDSAHVGNLVDSSSATLLQELNRVHCYSQAAPIVAICGLLGIVVMLSAHFPAWSCIIAALGLCGLVLYVRHLDVTRGTAILHYNLDSEAARAFAGISEGFARLNASASLWHIEAAGRTDDWKRNAGASGLVRRRSIRPALARPPRVECNVEIPALPAGTQTMFFFPDRILVYTPSGVGAVEYSDLEVVAGVTRFIEEEGVPPDSEIVDRTWKYVNKKGGPDRRFANNRELPIVMYGVLQLTSRSGLNERYNCSSPQNAAAFAAALMSSR